ncbi:MAG: hypothetical protein QOD69_3382 [Solirubrobacteraceae bacterium]|nr:hypothetical protein [Solirubrobacteraceae bacterium]
MDAGGHASYRRGVGSRRPSLLAVVVTAAAGCVLAAGGYLYGTRADGGAAPARVPVQTLEPAKGADPIVVPSKVDLPRR